MSRVDDGLVSPLLHDLEIGTRLNCGRPMVISYGAPQPDRSTLLRLVRVWRLSFQWPVTCLLKQSPISQTILLSSRDWEGAVGRDELSALAATSQWLNVVHTFTRDEADARARFHRRIDAPMLDAIDTRTAEKIYVCGWPEMVETTRVSVGTDWHSGVKSCR